MKGETLTRHDQANCVLKSSTDELIVGGLFSCSGWRDNIRHHHGLGSRQLPLFPGIVVRTSSIITLQNCETVSGRRGGYRGTACHGGNGVRAYYVISGGTLVWFLQGGRKVKPRGGGGFGKVGNELFSGL